MDSAQSNTNSFIHSGVISKMTDHSLIVSLSENVHCESCRAKGTCGVSDSASKEIEVPISDGAFKLNETVNVLLKKELGLQAVFWAYVFPFLLMILTLLISSFFLAEWLAGILSITILIPYYLILYVTRNSFKKNFKISIIKA
ncbi:SoxR reducing system RseC family protein [Namhaeicola litoreus]|uniref:SoxR reducing system RseC family protein n=1 Tax=Namhaeicola litoreus TaxID=1052145 RepID=A0ABW3Y4E2_9FLAO